MFDINLYIYLIENYKRKFRKTQDKWSLTENLINQSIRKENKKTN